MRTTNQWALRLVFGTLLLAAPAGRAYVQQEPIGPPAGFRDLDTWSRYDSGAQETETGVAFILDGGKAGTIFLWFAAIHAGRAPTTPPRHTYFEISRPFRSAISDMSVVSTLKITVDAGKPYQTAIDFTPRLYPDPDVVAGRKPANPKPTGRKPADVDELLLLADAETIRVSVYGADFTWRPDQIKALAAFADRIAVRGSGVGPTLTVEKKRFAAEEPLLFWVGVRTSSGGAIRSGLQKPGTLTITRPDRTTRTEAVPWPGEGVTSRSWRRILGMDPETPLRGEYRAVFEHGGRDSPPVFFFIEDVPVLRQIAAAFVFPSPLRLVQSRDAVTLVIENKSYEIIRVAHRGDTRRFVAVEIEKADGSASQSVAYPAAAFFEAAKLPLDQWFPREGLTWATIDAYPNVTIRPGGTYRLQLPLGPLLSSLQPPLAAGEYQVTFSTLLDVLVSRRGGPWSELSPMRKVVTSSTSASK